MFVFLALIFGVGFVVFGVGSGLPSGLGDILRGTGGTNAPSASEARERIAKSPRDPAGYRQLAEALRAEGKTDAMIVPLERYVSLRPGDTDALRELAGLYYSKGTQLQERAQRIQYEAQMAAPAAALPTGLQVEGNQPFVQDKITQTLTEQANERLNRVVGEMQTTFAKAAGAYGRLAALEPDDPSLQLQLAQTAEAGGDTQTAIRAYRRFLKLAPQDPNAPIVRQQIKLLQSSAAQGAGS